MHQQPCRCGGHACAAFRGLELAIVAVAGTFAGAALAARGLELAVRWAAS